MDNTVSKQIKNIQNELNKGNLGRALSSIRSLINANPQLIYDQELENIENAYRLMLDYMKKVSTTHNARIYTKA